MTEHVHDGGEAQVLDAALTPVGQRETQVLRGHKHRREGVRRLRGQRPLPVKPTTQPGSDLTPPTLALPW